MQTNSLPVYEIEPGQVPDLAANAGEVKYDISFFVPCYNEEDNVSGAITTIAEACTKLSLRYEVLVFDDCSHDKTVQVVTDFIDENQDIPVSLYTNKENQGVARNFVEGAFRARGRYYRLVCGDDVEPLASHLKLLERMGETDMVIPFYTEIGGRSSQRHLISNTFTLLVNVFSGNKLKYYNGCPIYKKSDVLRFHVETTGFGYQAEFLTRLLHEERSYTEVPLISIDREGSGSLNFRNFVSVAHSLLKISLRRLRANLFK